MIEYQDSRLGLAHTLVHCTHKLSTCIWYHLVQQHKWSSPIKQTEVPVNNIHMQGFVVTSQQKSQKSTEGFITCVHNYLRPCTTWYYLAQ